MKKRNLLLVLLVLVGCKNDPPDQKEPEKIIQEVNVDFKSGSFGKTELALLEELNICELDQAYKGLTATCSPDNFQFYQISDQQELKDLFLIQTKAGIVLKGESAPLPVRHILIFERENGKLVKTNGIRGELIGLETGGGDHKNIIVAIYSKADDTVFQCVLNWKEGKYSFNHVRSIDWGEGPKPIKAEMRDSVSSEIYTSLVDQHIFF